MVHQRNQKAQQVIKQTQIRVHLGLRAYINSEFKESLSYVENNTMCDDPCCLAWSEQCEIRVVLLVASSVRSVLTYLVFVLFDSC